MTVLVTGGCGYIGAHVVHALHQAGQRVVVVDDLSYGKPTRIEGSRLYGMDVSAAGAGERLAEIMKAEEVDAVIHFAARKQVGESVEKPLWYYQQNINGMLNMLIGMRDSGVKKLVFSSSAATYGEPPVDVVPEDVVPMLPINPYGQTKLFGEWMARACETAYDIRFCGLRYFNVAGCGPVELEDPAILNLIPMLFNRLKQGKAPAIFGDDYPTDDGTCVRDYIHVSDLADAHVAALEYLDRDERKYDVFNVGTGEGTSVRQIVDEVKKVTGLPFTETVMPRRAGDPPHLIGSPKRINEEMGWHAKYNVEDIVKSAWDAWQANPEHHIDVETWKQAD
ncbi:UDP-glucose 4-epimerase GalE [Bifidobacterium pullorum]|uniref:UDP-glucose 4-epimerase GalE n=1 Tax=Bifidobacterium pullorum TaxID=78448 RepID=UPI003AF1BC61